MPEIVQVMGMTGKQLKMPNVFWGDIGCAREGKLERHGTTEENQPFTNSTNGRMQRIVCVFVDSCPSPLGNRG